MITTAKQSSILQGFPKYRSMLAGNSPYLPPSFESIATTTATGGTTVTFSSIPSTYKHLQVRILASSTTDYVNINLTANGSTTGYASHFVYGTGTTIAAANYSSATAIRLSSGGGNGLTTFGHNAFIIDILDYANTSTNKTFRMFQGSAYNTTGGEIYFGSGLWTNTSAISSLTFTATGNYANPSYFALYGIKEA